MPSPAPARLPGSVEDVTAPPLPAADVAAALGGGALPSAAAAEAHAKAARAAMQAGVPGEFLLRGAPLAMSAAADVASTPAPAAYVPAPPMGRAGSGGGLPGKPASVVTRLAGSEPRVPTPTSRLPTTPPPSPAAGPGPGAASLGLETAEEFPEAPSLGPGTKGAVGAADHRFAQHPRPQRAASAPLPGASTPARGISSASEAASAASQLTSPSGVPPAGTVRRAAAAYGAAAVAAAADVNVTLWRNGERAAPPVPLTKARLRARKHAGALLPTVQEALDAAAAEGRGPHKGAKVKSTRMHRCNIG